MRFIYSIVLIILISNCSDNKIAQKSKPVSKNSIQPDTLKIEENQDYSLFDNLKYEIKLEKHEYSQTEIIPLIIIVRNMTNQSIRAWLESDGYPTGTLLSLNDINGNSQIKAHRSILSSQIYFEDEIEKMKTTIPPNGSIFFSYNLRNIVQLKNELPFGEYHLSYANSDTVYFKIR